MHVHRWVYGTACAVLLSSSLLCPAIADAQDEPSEPTDPGGSEPAKPNDAAQAIGRPCDPNFFQPCAEGLVCIENRCAPRPEKKRTRRGEEEDGATVETSTEAQGKVIVVRERVIDRSRPFRFGVENGFFFGFGGKLKNPKPAYNIAADFAFPSGRAIRWHVEIGYQNLNGFTGFRVNPFIIGYTIPIIREPVHLEAEVIGAILQSEILFNNGYAIALSSGLRAQIVLLYGPGYVAFAPLGFEIRYAYGLQSIGIDTGVGANWPLMLTVGLEL
jgi:hypothetical protein